MKTEAELVKEEHEEFDRAINKLIDGVPNLTIEGLEDPDNENFEERRQKLRNSMEDIDNSISWVDCFLEKRKTFNNRVKSHTLNTMCKNWHTHEGQDALYTNGILITAMLACNFKYVPCSHDPWEEHVYFNVSMKKYIKHLAEQAFYDSVEGDDDGSIDFCTSCGCTLGSGGCEHCMNSMDMWS